jgi:adenylate kinase family enzyme
MYRISVVGTTGSGKTTLARRIAATKNLPHIELDAIHWGPDWTPLSLEEFRRRVQTEVAQDQWVIDGNYGKVRDIVLSRATHLVWLNLPFPLVFWRTLKRTARRVFTRQELWAGNRETLRGALFERDSILWWVIRTHGRRMREYRRLVESDQYSHLVVYEIRNSDDLKEMLLSLGIPESGQSDPEK